MQLSLLLLMMLVLIAATTAQDKGHDINSSEKTKDDAAQEESSGATKKKKVVCVTRDCVAASHRLFNNMYEEVDPCEDFHTFACGRFIDTARIPEDRGSITSFQPLNELILERGRTLLETPNDDKNDFEVYKKARDHYKACINEEKLDDLGIKPVQYKLNDLGGWPILEGDKWDGKDYKWWDQIYKMNKLGFTNDQLVSFGTYSDAKNSSWRVLLLDQPSLGMSREYLIKGFEDKDVQHYYNYMVETVQLFGAEKAAAEQEMKAVLLFEIKLANASAPREERRNVTKLYNPTTLAEFKTGKGFPGCWTNFVQDLLTLEGVDVKVSGDEKVIIRDPGYFKNASGILKLADSRVVANYLGWRTVESVMNHLNTAARNVKQKYNKAINGVNEAPATWKRCVKTVGFGSYSTTNFVFAASSMYAKAYFKPEAKEAMLEMTSYIRDAFGDILNELDWMDDVTKERAHEKLKAMDQFIAYSDELLNQNAVDNLHAGLKVDESDYLGNILNLKKFWRAFYYNRLRDKIDPTSWIEHRLVAVVNAFYNPSQNNMEFPAGILQGVFFDDKVPKYMNFGAIGAVIGHEITHGFDDRGRQRDLNGDLENWWQPETDEKFKERAQCIVDQYSNYSIPHLNISLNGITTQGENIADNGGIKESYRAYKKWAQDNGEEASLPGHPYSPQQLFWISYGQVWCAKYRDAALNKIVLTGAHSPGNFRIIGPLSNFDEFARDFNCKVGSKMNPEKKCKVW